PGGGDGDFDDVVFTASGLTTHETRLSLAPLDASADVGGTACVTGTVTDETGMPVAHVEVDFAATGANPAFGTVTTDDAGQASFCYSGQQPGADTIHATSNGAMATAARTWRAAQPVNRPPVAHDGSASTPPGVPISIALDADDADGDSLTFTVV